MRILRESLIQLFQSAWASGATTTPSRVKAVVIELSRQLLAVDKPHQHGVSSRLLSYGRLHRYVMVIHCPDQAFYPDAIRAYFQKNNIQPVQQQSVLFSRQKDSRRLLLPDSDGEENGLLLVVHLPAATTLNIETIKQDIAHVLAGVQHSVQDFSRMQQTLEHIATHLFHDEPMAAELLQWVLDNHYLLFGIIKSSSKKKNQGICKNKQLLASLLPDLHQSLTDTTQPHCAGLEWLHMDALFAHLYSSTNVEMMRLSWHESGELQSVIVIGHFSRGARYINASRLPQFKQYWYALAADSALQQSSFYKREIRTLFDRAPKPLLHSVPVQQWLEPFKRIVDMNSPTQVVTARLTPKTGNIEYLLIAVNSQRFGNNIWANMQKTIEKQHFKLFGVEHYSVGSTHLVFAAVQSHAWPHPESLQHAIRQCVIFWKDQARQIMLQETLPAALLHDALQELNVIPNLYQDQFMPEQFVRDVLVREQVHIDNLSKVRMHLHQQEAEADQTTPMVEIHVLAASEMPLALMTEKLNAFSLVTMEQALIPFNCKHQDLHINVFRCVAPEMLHPEGLPRLCHGIQDVFNNLADHDPLNALVILAGLNIRDVLVLISLRNHLVQLMPETSVAGLSAMLIKYPKVSLQLFRLFESKHRLAMPEAYMEQSKVNFDKAMQEVQSLNEDTWFNALASLISVSLRSNAWERETGQALAIKINPSLLDFAPRPRPYREIFVHGVCVEGVHLRGGAVSRGGLRFSDRPSDFRTEVLELMATQVVKNGQIVPTGAKGGFVVRDGDGADFVLAQYRMFIRALLSITDNLQGKTLLPPANIKIAKEDKNDSYLVVAADKGTARFSDDANAEALQADFWLGDAFASGGSNGYDHKAYGITARGAWECAAHHFARQGHDLWQDEVSVVAIGDMGGDVFGNGMLLNPNMKLVAAFNHMHIFLDPTPDVAASFAERERLFAKVLGWGAYDTQLISEGGGVFHRAAKSIALSARVREVLGMDEEHCSGEQLIKALLQAPVDLLYNGGIGTYIKASFESNADAQDPANNAVRIDANRLRCKVLSEGGNLGLTQAARIEFAQASGIINTDAIDNAAGVNMSDHEVNLKILLAAEPIKQRNQWLRKVADAVTIQCLNDNKEQAVALSLAEETARQHLPKLRYLQQMLCEDGRLNHIEKDPASFALRPVFAEWLGHEKNRVHEALDGISFRSKSVFGDMFLYQYFPQPLRKKFAQAIDSHVLANDIAHTRMSSYLLNRYGLTSIHSLQNMTGFAVAEIVQALLVADYLLDTGKIYDDCVASPQQELLDCWYQAQQQVLAFAEGMLTFSDIFTIDMVWLKKTRKALHMYNKEGKSLAYLARLAIAVPLAEKVGMPLHRCFEGLQECLDLLPFSKLEASLHTPLWASYDAHALRCEWLKRLACLKTYATEHVLSAKHKKTMQAQVDWVEHPLWQTLHHLLEQKDAENNDEQRLRHILALTHLQSIIESESARD